MQFPAFEPIHLLWLVPAAGLLLFICLVLETMIQKDKEGMRVTDARRTTPAYLSIMQMLETLPEPNRTACVKLLRYLLVMKAKAPGSTHNHQAWDGGYLDHVAEIMNIATRLYPALHLVRPLPFTLGDVYLVLFLHDLEKPWKYVLGENELLDPALADKAGRMDFRLAKAAEYGIVLTDAHRNGIEFAEGENHKYSNRHRHMEPLAAFVHLCDVWSARGWFDHPAAADDPWRGAERHVKA
jgi:hypothetical protein